VADYRTLLFTEQFLEMLLSKEFNHGERRQFLKALRLLDTNEKHHSLRAHELTHDLAGKWSASASKSLRMTFTREAEGKKRMLTCSHHYE
jgi:mRNA-degrading endonuclease YafQ of YafQ-DinJ toxin-antitoxin module